MKEGAIRLGIVGAGVWELLRSVMRDQIRWIYDRSHQRRLTHQNGRDSLALAIAATELADRLK